MSCRSSEISRLWAIAIPGRTVAATRTARIILHIIQIPLLSGPIRRKKFAYRHSRFLMIRPERRGNAIVSFMKASVAKCIREQPDIIQAKQVGIERSEEHTSELQSLMRSSYAALCFKKKMHSVHSMINCNQTCDHT